jgi:hypothetical protein
MRVVLCILPAAALACGGMSGPAQLSVGGTYETTVNLVPGGSCSSPTVANNPTVVAHSPGAMSLTLTHAGNTYSGTVTTAGAFTVPATSVGGGTQVSIAGQFSSNGFTATTHVQQTGCAYDVSWVGAKQGPPNTYPDPMYP